MLRTEAFRFVIVSFNHYSLPQRLEADLRALFPNRPFLKIDAQTADYQSISTAYGKLGRGFCWIEHFDDLLKEDSDSTGKESPTMAANNERRRHITAGLNLRRDRLAQSPVALFVLVPTSVGEQFARLIMEKMPDMWSFRSFILDLRLEHQAISERLPVLTPALTRSVFELDEKSRIAAEMELQRLLVLFLQTPEEERAYRLTLYPQIIDRLAELRRFKQALLKLEQWQREAPESDMGDIYLKRGICLREAGQLKAARTTFEDALMFYEKKQSVYKIAQAHKQLGDVIYDMGDLTGALYHYLLYNEQLDHLLLLEPESIVYKRETAISYERIGQVYRANGHYLEALKFYNKSLNLIIVLYEKNIENIFLKNYLAILHQHIGIVHVILGDLTKALIFFEQFNYLESELCQSYPENVEFRNNLATSFQFLGNVLMSLGSLDKALVNFEHQSELFEALNSSFPDNISFMHGLAISYQYLGNTYRLLNQFNKALDYFEKYNQLATELCKSHPENIEFKNVLATSYIKLGDLYSVLGDLPKALVYTESARELLETLTKSYSNSIELKNGLAIAYEKLGDVHAALGNATIALSFFEKYLKLSKELHQSYPENMEYKILFAISLLLLGQFYLRQINDKIKAKEYIQKGYQLYEQLVEDYPDYQALKLNYAKAQDALKKLEE